MNSHYIEVLNRPRAESRPTHIVFDHDGTLSTLRYGWEAIMAPMMFWAITDGKKINGVLATEIRQAVDRLIDETTGIQTLRQMHLLGRLVERFGIAKEVRDAHAYKAIYNHDLMDLVDGRISPLLDGTLGVADVEMKNARSFLQGIRNVTGNRCLLHLTSGTDLSDLKRESIILGTFGWFQTVTGATGRIEDEAKSTILKQLIGSLPAGESIAVIGDGPVEICAGREVGAFTIGVCSDEVRRHGWNPRKRDRLQRAGADVLIPDFSDLRQLFWLLRIR